MDSGLRKLQAFAEAALSMPLGKAEPLQGGGSERIFYRFPGEGASCIGVIGGQRAETRAFLGFTAHFAAKGIPVPRILAQSSQGRGGMYLMEDLGTATLAEESGEWEGRTCAIVDLEIEASGELPEPEFGGRGGRGFSFEPASSTVVENTFSVKLEGHLYFSVEDGMPLGLELEGTMTNERTTSRERGESTFRTSTTREGTYTYRVVVTVE